MAKQVIADCYQCRLRRKVILNQVMAPLPQERVGPVPIFDAVAIDLFAPLELKDMVRKEVSGKEWGIIFVCIATLAIYIVLTELYFTDSFLQAMRQFICAHGTPSKVQSDHRTQLMAAAREVAVAREVPQWDFSGIQEWWAVRKFMWDFIPTGGQAERIVDLNKKYYFQFS